MEGKGITYNFHFKEYQILLQNNTTIRVKVHRIFARIWRRIKEIYVEKGIPFIFISMSLPSQYRCDLIEVLSKLFMFINNIDSLYIFFFLIKYLSTESFQSSTESAQNIILLKEFLDIVGCSMVCYLVSIKLDYRFVFNF